MTISFSYRHLYYFWVVGKEGGMSRAAQRLGGHVQVSSSPGKGVQVRVLLGPA